MSRYTYHLRHPEVEGLYVPSTLYLCVIGWVRGCVSYRDCNTGLPITQKNTWLWECGHDDITLLWSNHKRGVINPRTWTPNLEPCRQIWTMQAKKQHVHELIWVIASMHSNAQVCNSCADLSIPSDTVYASIAQNAMNVLSVRQCWWAHWKYKTTCPGHLVHRHIRLVTQVANTADKNTFQAKWLHFTGFDSVLAGLK